jgi:hypothetical protein
LVSYEIVGGCVAPARLAPFLRTLQAETGCIYASIYRGSDADPLLHRLGKHDQGEEYHLYITGQEPNPANPPGRSTHECKSDGVPYPGPIGRQLEPWQCGIDVDDAHVPAMIAAAARHGWVLFQPYPGGREYHHLNFRFEPKSPLIDLRVGDTGVLVRILSIRLHILGYFKPRRSDIFGRRVHGALVAFQQDYGLQVDGVAGPKSWARLKQAVEHPETRTLANRARRR